MEWLKRSRERNVRPGTGGRAPRRLGSSFVAAGGCRFVAAAAADDGSSRCRLPGTRRRHRPADQYGAGRPTNTGAAGPRAGCRWRGQHLGAAAGQRRARPRWETDDRRYFEQAFADAGVEHTIVNAEGDAPAQQAQAEQAIADGASVILLISIDTGSGATIIDSPRRRASTSSSTTASTPAARAAPRTSASTTSRWGPRWPRCSSRQIDDLGQSPARVVMLNGGEEDNNAFLFRTATTRPWRSASTTGAGSSSPTSSCPAGARTARARRSWSRS